MAPPAPSSPTPDLKSGPNITLSTEAASNNKALDLLLLQEETAGNDASATSAADGSEPVAWRALRTRIDLRLLPLLCLTYALQSIDKTTLGYAAVFGLKTDTSLTGTQYSWLGALFYLGYLVSQFPTGLLLQRLPVNRVLAFNTLVWGAVLMCHAATDDFAGLAAARTFLGVFESSAQPATMLLFAMYYARSEQPLRMGVWIGSAGLGYIIAGIASFGIGHIGGSLASWRLIFLIWGAVTFAWGVVIAVFLPGSPLTAGFLAESDRAVVVARVKHNGTGIENKTFKWPQFREAMLDAKTWLLFVFAVASNAPNGGLTTFQSLIIQGMGFSTLETTLVQMPSGAVQMIICPLACFFASRYPNARIAVMLVCLAPFLAGILGLWLVAESQPYGRLACLWISFAYTATWTLSMSVATANTAGHTKKITTNAMLLIGYCLGNFVGPFFFLEEQAPRYSLGVGMMLFCVALQVLCLVAMWLLLWRRNRSRRDLHQAAGGDMSPEAAAEAYARGFLDETDFENKFFRYVY